MRDPLPPVKPPSAILNMNRGFSAFSSRRPLDRGSSRGGPGRSSRSPFTSSARVDGQSSYRRTVSSQIPRLLPVLHWPLEQLPTQDPGSWSPDSTSRFPQGPRVQSFHPLPLLPKSPVSPSGLSLCSCPSNGFSSPLSPGIDSVAVGRGRGQQRGCHPHSLTPEEGTPKF